MIDTANVSFRDLFYGDLPNGLPGRAVTALNYARGVCATISGWQDTDTLAQRGNQIRDIAKATLGDDAATAWDTFHAPLISEMRLSELRDYVWVDNAQQHAEVLTAVCVVA